MPDWTRRRLVPIRPSAGAPAAAWARYFQAHPGVASRIPGYPNGSLGPLEPTGRAPLDRGFRRILPVTDVTVNRCTWDGPDVSLLLGEGWPTSPN